MGAISSRTTFGVLALAVGLGGLVAVGCTRLNESHCGNQSGDLTCEQRGGSTPYCDKCEAANDGCVAEPVTEPGCGFGVGGGSSSGGSGSGDTSDAVDSSGSGGPACGNGTIDEGEACDGDALPDGTSCEAQGHGVGTPVCALDCSDIVYAVCPDYSDCGDGSIAPGEECDLDNLNEKTCDDFPGFTGSGLVCNDQCTFNISGCTSCRESGQACGDGDTCCELGDECVAVAKKCCPPGLGGLCAT